ncbi:MAG: radical SAM protein [Rubripirellula sp.]
MIVRNPSLSPDKPYLVVREREPDGNGGLADVLTVLLTASECPIGCSMCDLWKNTLETPTPSGAIARQLDMAIGDSNPAGWIKLYNSGNFFDRRSIPPGDYMSIANRVAGYQRVIVENHPKIGRRRLLEFRDLIDAPLEIAVGLETVQPRWLGRLGKQMSRGDFDAYANWLAKERVDLRVFLIVGVPGIDEPEAVRWAKLSVRHAIHAGARHVSLIPARAGHGWNGRAGELPVLAPSTLANLLDDTVADARGRACVTMDLWDQDSNCHEVARMNETNLNQRSPRS